MDTHQSPALPLRTAIQIFFTIIVAPFLPLLISERWNWWEACAYALISIFGFGISRVLAARRHPDLLAERSRFLQHEDTKPWDKTLAALVGLGGILIPIVAGMEVSFDETPDFSPPLRTAALVLLVAGYGLGAYALMENRFFSGVVRIQKDRGHHVISSGPYRWVRHPGYAGGLLTYAAVPLLLDSIWAFLPAVFLAVVLVIRTRLEDDTLQAELDGYRAYTQRVRYRLIPGVW